MKYNSHMENLYKNKKVLILGLGINQGGLGATRFFAKAGAKVKVTDLKDKEFLKPSLDALKEFPEIEYVLGEHRFDDLDWADLIIRNPALRPENPYLKYAKEKGKHIEMDMGIFLQFVNPEQIIGITGTKGKSTTASLIYQALKAGGKDVFFAGNIGKSVLDTIPVVKKDSLVVLELSSFQLEGFDDHKVSPKYAVITNIFPDHLNYYGTMESYIESKRIIAKYQTKNDYLFLKEADEITSNPKFLTGLEGQVVYYALKDLPQDFSPKLPGEHNLENFAAALAVSNKILASKGDASSSLSDEALGLRTEGLRARKAVENFQGVEFRLQIIYDKNGTKIYNDTAATNPESTIQALKSLPNSILICGGVNKNLPYEDLAAAIHKHTKAVFFLKGTATDEIISKMAKIGHQSADKIQGIYSDLEKLVRDVKDITKPKDTILFSPGAASFNLFQNEFDRGRKFNAAVEKIFG